MARSFDDGSSEYLYNAGAPVTATPCTLACWFYSDDLTVNQNLIGLGNSGATRGQIRILAAGNVGGDPVRAQQQDAVSAATGNADSSSGYSANTWHHACGVFTTDDDRTVYLDGGSSVNNTDVTGDPSIDHMSIGVLWRSDLIQYMSGNIAEAAVWNVALTAAEAATLATGYSPLFVRPASLISYWPLLRNEDQDRVGDYDLTNSGGGVAAHPGIIYPQPRLFIPIAAVAAAGNPWYAYAQQ
jgi:hypothetical protein